MKTFRFFCFLLLCCAFAAPAPAADLPISEDMRLLAIDMTLAIAQEELGYAESEGGHTKYGEWAGGAYKEWCSEFVSWCVDQTDQRLGTEFLGSLYPMQDTCEEGFEFFLNDGRYISATGNVRGYGEQWYLADGGWVSETPYVPERGDCLYIEWYAYNRLDHVALVGEVIFGEDGMPQILTIEGNNPDAVAQFTYLANDESLRGYGATKRLVGTTMQSGAKGALVGALQQTLVSQGYLDEKWVTGEFGENTEGAIRRAQQALGLAETGIADRDTQKALGLW